MRNLMWGAFAAGLVLAGSGVSWANDNVRLGGSAAEEAIQGGIDVLTRGGYHGGHHGGHHGGYHGGYRGGYHHHGGYHGGYRGGYGYHGGYGVRVAVGIGGFYGGYGYGRGYYGGYGGYYRPYYASYYSSYYPAYYPTYYPSYCYEPSYYPINGGLAPQATLQSSYARPAPQNYVPPMPLAEPDRQQYQYDGDPREPIPMPNRPVPKVVPIDGRLVSLSDEITGGVTQINPVAPQRTTTTPATGVTYPAYGEAPITPAPRKVNR